MSAAESERALDRRRRAIRRYTLAVRTAKVALPVLALLIVALIFWTGRERGGIEDMFTAEELVRLGAGLRLDNPRFAGVTENGEPYVLRAATAMPDGPVPDEIGLEAPEGELTFGDGRLLTGRSETGMMHRGDKMLTLTGDVVLETSDGYRFETPELTIDFGKKTARSVREVHGSGPNGEIDAGSFRILSDGEDLRGAVIRFEDRVRVLFTPSGND